MDGYDAVVTAAASVLTALIAGLLTAWTTRRKASLEVQTSLNEGFKTLISELQDERTALREVVMKQQARIEALEDEIVRMRSQINNLRNRSG